jgi:glucokinase
VTAHHFVGVDVGGTKIAVAGLAAGELSESKLLHTELEDQDKLVDQIAGAIEDARTDDTRAVGIGVPSLVEFATGRIASSVNIPLKDVPLRELLSDRCGLPVYVDNDATCAALAEAFDEGRLTCEHLVLFTVGTGVGGGLVLNGKVYRGAVGMAAEVGHTLIGLDLHGGAPPASGEFPQPGSLEYLASGRALDRLALDAAREDANSHLGRRLNRDDAVSGVDVVEGARTGDRASLRCLEILGERLGIGIANAINVFDPLEVVIGGGVSAAGDLLLEPARRVALQHVVPGAGSRTTIRLARHGPRAGVLGAALIAAQEWADDNDESGRGGSAAVATKDASAG